MPEILSDSPNRLDKLPGVEQVIMGQKKNSNGTFDFNKRVPEGELPEGLQGKHFELYVDSAKHSTPINVFYAPPKTLDSAMNKLIGPGTEMGWVAKDFNTRSSNKNHLKHLHNEKSGETFIAIPVTQNHFKENRVNDGMHSGHLIVPEVILQENHNFAVMLNHTVVPVVNENEKWQVDPKSPLSDVIQFDGGTGKQHPKEIYLLSEEELRSYQGNGARKGWQESSTGDEKNGERIFRKIQQEEFGQAKVVEERLAKPIMLGDQKMYLLSNKENLDSVTIKDPELQKAKVVDPTNVAGKMDSAEQTSFRGVIEKVYQDIKTMPAFINSDDQKNILQELDQIKNTFNEKITSGQLESDPQGLKKFQGEVQQQLTKPNLSEFTKTFLQKLDAEIGTHQKDFDLSQPSAPHFQQQTLSRGVPGRNIPSPPSQQDAANQVAGAIAGTMIGGANVIGATFRSVGSAISGAIKLHHERKMARLQNPDLVSQEQEAKAEKLNNYRVSVAKRSNSNVDAMMESALHSKKAISEHPVVQQIHAMVDEDPSKLTDAQDRMAELIKEDPNLKQHHKNLMRNMKEITGTITSNLKENQIAGLDMDERKEKFDKFNKTMSNDPLADTLQDEDRQTTLRENLQKMAALLAKFFKELFMKINNGRNQEDSAPNIGNNEDSAPAAASM